MSLTKAVDGMAYEVTGSKKVNGKGAATKYVEQLSSFSLVWLLVKRHKIGLLAMGNVVLVLNWAFPEWLNVVKSLLQSI